MATAGCGGGLKSIQREAWRPLSGAFPIARSRAMSRSTLLCLALLLVPAPLLAADLESQILAEREADIDLGSGSAAATPAQVEESLLRNRIAMEQSGRDNYARVEQSGSANFASVSQQGVGASAYILQSGSGNTAVIVQR
ncbi:hypothetical protein D0B54_04080 [Solimonas sp. K1W22B-7]|nr:hypothetical protein D0B54_04080 [Solimonas sp. K1W22B-7]